ncbi:MAG: MATE family efflux transporter [Oscillospiraceae bacterium]|nr:MATE family efflux transporter [Oscillospiraceae bacterium]
MENNKQIDLMANAPVNKAILKLSIPVVCGMMVQVLYNLVDTFFVGKLGDANQLAAANITAPVFMMLLAIATIVSTGAASYISRCLGSGDTEKASKTLSTGFFICTALAVLVGAAGLIFLKPLIGLLAADEGVFPYAYSYTFTILCGSIPIMLSYTGGQLIRAEGAAMASIKGMIAGTLTNIILDPIFIFVFDMGITGAGIATVIANLVALLVHLRFYLSDKSVLKLSVKGISFAGDIWGQTFAIGTPAALSQVLISVALVVCNNLIRGYPDSANILAGMGIVSKLNYIGTFIFMGFAAGCQPLVGYNFGARNIPRVRKIIKNAMLITLGVGAVLFVVFGFGAPLLVGLFSPLEPVVSWGVRILRVQMFMFLWLGPQMIAATSLQALGRALPSLFLSIARQGIFFIPLLFAANSLFGLTGLFMAQPVADLLTLALGCALLWFFMRKAQQRVVDQADDSQSIS